MGGLCDVFCFVGICKNKASIRKKFREKRFRDLSELGMMLLRWHFLLIWFQAELNKHETKSSKYDAAKYDLIGDLIKS